MRIFYQIYVISFLCGGCYSVAGPINKHSGNNQTTFTAYLIANKPYVWERNGTVEGIIPQLFQTVTKEFTNFHIRVKVVNWSLDEINSIIKSDDPLHVLRNKPGFDANDNSANLIIGANNYNKLNMASNQFLPIPAVHSKGLVGVVHRETIGLGEKLFQAMSDSVLIIYNGLILACIMGVIVWWIECTTNEEMFPSTFTDGLLNGLWYAIVSMTTVGYGDMVPRARLGKLVSIVYILISTLIIAALTSVFTERMTNTDIDLKGKKITVVSGTFDESVSKRYIPRSGHQIQNIIAVTRYEEAFKKVERREVYASLVDYTVGAWIQDELLMKDLRFTKYIQQEFDHYIFVLGHNDSSKHDMIERLKSCIEYGKSITQHHVENYVEPITFIRLDMPNMKYAIRTLGITPIISGVAGFITLLVFCYLIVLRRRSKKKKNLIMEDVLAEKDRELTLRFLEKKLDERLRLVKMDIIQDYKELLEDVYHVPESNSEGSELFILK